MSWFVVALQKQRVALAELELRPALVTQKTMVTLGIKPNTIYKPHTRNDERRSASNLEGLGDTRQTHTITPDPYKGTVAIPYQLESSLYFAG